MPEQKLYAPDGVAAKRDWEIWRPMLKSPGVAAFHDIVSETPDPNTEVFKLWAEIKKLGFQMAECVAPRENVPDPTWVGHGIGLVFL
jgi:hypothetical protein